jgi:UDP-N-acetylmuramoylalanine-D-glutamate ligase
MVLEISSFQLETIESFHPKVAVVLNVTPDHLDRHGTFRAYADAKARIFENQTADDFSVLNADEGQCVDLAERMIKLSGLQPGHDIEIVFTGMRPGERLNEILFASEEPAVEIGISGIMAAKPNEPPMQSLREWIAALKQAVEQDDRASIKEVLKDAVPEFTAGIAPASQSATARIEQAGS